MSQSLFFSESVSRDPNPWHRGASKALCDRHFPFVPADLYSFPLGFLPWEAQLCELYYKAPIPFDFLLNLVNRMPQKKIQGREGTKVGYLFPDPNGWVIWSVENQCCSQIGLFSTWLCPSMFWQYLLPSVLLNLEMIKTLLLLSLVVLLHQLHLFNWSPL